MLVIRTIRTGHRRILWGLFLLAAATVAVLANLEREDGASSPAVNSAAPQVPRVDSASVRQLPGIEAKQRSSADTASNDDAAETVAVDAYIPLAGAESLEEMARFTDGAAIVEVTGGGRTITPHSERRPATEADVREFAANGKTVEVGQMIGGVGFPLTTYEARIEWLDGSTEDGTLVANGGAIDGTTLQLAGVPLPEPGVRYLFFLRRTERGLVPEAIQFVVDADGRLRSHTFPNAPLASELSGRLVQEVAGEIVSTYDGLPPRPAGGVRPAGE